MSEKDNKKERYIATLLGCAVGDVLGMPVEIWKKEEISQIYGRITEPVPPIYVRTKDRGIIRKDSIKKNDKLKYHNNHLGYGDYTDDTILTLAIAESIADIGDLDIEEIAANHVAVYHENMLPNGQYKGGFGKTTMLALQDLANGKSIRDTGQLQGPGAGPAMKMHPVGLYMDATGKINEGFGFAQKISKITHKDPRSIYGGVLQAYSIYLLLSGNISKDDFLHSLSAQGYLEGRADDRHTLPEKGSLWSRIEWIVNNKDATAEDAFNNLGNSGLAWECHPFALFMFQKYWDDQIAGLIETVNWGGDCDTTGAIYGALCGARNGMIFPDRWVDPIKGKDKIIDLGSRLYDSLHEPKGLQLKGGKK